MVMVMVMAMVMVMVMAMAMIVGMIVFHNGVCELHDALIDMKGCSNQLLRKRRTRIVLDEGIGGKNTDHSIGGYLFDSTRNSYTRLVWFPCASIDHR